MEDSRQQFHWHSNPLLNPRKVFPNKLIFNSKIFFKKTYVSLMNIYTYTVYTVYMYVHTKSWYQCYQPKDSDQFICEYCSNGSNRQQPWAAGLLSLMLEGLTWEMVVVSTLELHVQPAEQQGYDTPLIPVLILWWLTSRFKRFRGLVAWPF